MSGVNNLMQQRHLRRLCLELIVPQAGRKQSAPINKKNGPARKAELKKEEKLSQRILKKIKRKKI